MDKLAQRLAEWFGSTPFIVFHMVWFGVWVFLHNTSSFDPDWSNLTILVSLEAIFLSLFILRAENIQSSKFEMQVRQDIKTSKQILDKLNGKKKS